MSNRAFIQPTIFSDTPDGELTYGWRLFDDYAKTYENSMPKELWDRLVNDDLSFMRHVMDNIDEVGDNILDSVVGNGLYIGGSWYDWEDVKHLWEIGED